MRITILGCGPSGGVPLVGDVWGGCDPLNPKNRRLRTSALIQNEGANLLIDTSPDLRQQLLQAQISTIDAVLYTHDHADHIHGIDDLRSVYFGMRQGPIPVYGSKITLDALQERFSYLFAPREVARPALYPEILSPHIIDLSPFKLHGLQFQPFEQDHGYSTTLGFRFDDAAYSTDVVRLDECAFEALEGLDLWIVDCLSRVPRPSHAHLALTLSWIKRLKPKRAVLIHLNQEMDYDAVSRGLPRGVELAYDGMRIDV